MVRSAVYFPMTSLGVSPLYVAFAVLGCGSGIGGVTASPHAAPALVEPAATPMVGRLYSLEEASPRTGLGNFDGCQQVAPVRVEASGVHAGSEPAHASDGQLDSSWNSGGFARQSIRFGFESGTELSGVLLMPAMTPASARVRHELQVTRPDCVDCSRSLEFHARMSDRGLYAFFLAADPMDVTEVEVHTLESPSWVAWREIVPFVCRAPVAARGVLLDQLPHLEAVPPGPVPDGPPSSEAPPAAGASTPSLTVVPGEGSCDRDSDCHPAVPCHATSCTDRPPSDEEGLCPASVAPFDYVGAGCFCNEGTCAARAPSSMVRP